MLKGLYFSFQNVIYSFGFALLFLLTQNSSAQLQANFTADTTSGCGSINVKFTSTSVGSNLTYRWNFGNGNSSTQQNPSASYQQAGTYTVQLIVSDGSNTDTLTKNNLIEVYPSPTANFNFNPQQGCAPLKVDFTSTSTTSSSGFQSYKWDFSDGSQPGSNKNTSHEYLSTGTYTPSLEVVDNNGCKAVLSKPSITVFPRAIAKFTTSNSPISCQYPYTVNFVNQSTGQNLTYLWNFGDNTTSTAENPSHKYNSLGRYDVTLIVTSSNCADTITLKEYVILEQSEAKFKLSRDTICLYETFEPIDNSHGARIYSWNFGDGNTSSFKTPKHSYQDSGYYEITLTVSAGASCTDTYKDSIYVQQLIADFTTTPSFYCNSFSNFKFAAKSNYPATYYWSLTNYEQFFDNEKTSHSYVGDSISHTERSTYPDSLFAFSDTLIAISKYGCRDTVVKDSNRTIQLMRTNIIVNNLFAPSSTDTLGFCIPDTITLKDTTNSSLPINSYSWTIGTNTYNQKVPPPLILNSAGIVPIQLTITNSLGCKASYSIAIKAGTKQQPDISFYPDTICQGDTLFIINNSSNKSLIDKYTYTLLSQDSGSKNVATFQTFADTNVYFTNYESIGNHEVELEVSYNGCDTSMKKGSVYIKGPIAKVTTSSLNCHNRKEIEFKAMIEGETKFYWDFGDGSPLDSVNKNPTHTYPENRLYRPMLIILNDTNNCLADTIKIGLNLAALPPLQISPGKMNFCLGDSGTFMTTDSSFYVSKVWRIDGKIVSKNGKFTKKFKERGIYVIELEVEEVLGCKRKVTDTIYVSRPIAKIGHEVLNGCLPSSIRFIDSSITDTTIAKWQWAFGNGDSSKQRVDTAIYTKAGYKDIFLRVENIFGCADSVLSRDHLRSTDFMVDFVADKRKVCSGDSVSFRNTSTKNGVTYTWRFGDNDSLISTDEFVGHRYTKAGKFQVELFGVSNSSCELTKVRTEYIEVEETPIASFTADTTSASCYPFEVNFIDQSTGVITDWSWSFGDNNNSKLPNPYHNYTANGNFDVSLVVSTSFGCTDSIHISDFIKIKAPTADIIIDKDSACIHEPISFSIINPNNLTSVFWDFGDGSSSTSYSSQHAYKEVGKRYLYLTLTDSATNCSVKIKDSIYIFENKAEFTINADTACQPFNAIFTNTSQGADSYEWNFGDGSSSTQNYNPNHLYESVGNYQVSLKIESKIGCKDTAYKNIVVNPKPKISIIPYHEICFGDSVVLEASGGSSYLWTPDSSLTDNSSAVQLAKPDVTTIYQVVAFNSYNCTDTAMVKIKVQQPPIAQAKGSQDTSLIIGEHIDLNVDAGMGFYYEWKPSDGLSCDDCPNPTAKPLASKQYIVKIADSMGCFIIYDTIFVEVIEKYSLDVPNTFTPNGDGHNDIIYAKGWGLKELLSFKIYNRMGEKLFESNDFNKGWDGRYKGKAQPIETYVYVVEGLTYSGKTISKKGNINLMR